MEKLVPKSFGVLPVGGLDVPLDYDGVSASNSARQAKKEEFISFPFLSRRLSFQKTD
ncbi:MAG: hypothetical protein N2C14_25630 [Planctomycetales bacterium]